MYHRPSPPSSDRDKRKEFPSNNTNSSSKSPVQDFHADPTVTNLSRSSSSANGSGGGGGGGVLEFRKFILFVNSKKTIVFCLL